MSDQPAITLLGYGVDDTLQLTVEAQRLLTRAGKAFALGLPPNLARHLASLRVETEDLSGAFKPGRPFSECYLEVADALFGRFEEEGPVVFLTHGHPLFLNSLNRFLILQARERGLTVDVRPAVSQLDTIIAELGLDVGTFGLQVFDARRLLARQIEVNPRVPLLVMNLAGFSEVVQPNDGIAEGAGIDALSDYLGRIYPQEHVVALVNAGGRPDAGVRAAVPLARIAEVLPYITTASHLFVDGVRRRSRNQPAPGAPQE